MHPSDWLQPRPAGLYCIPGDFYVDPVRAVRRAVITHGHSDHARSGHASVLATPETLAIMACRYGESFTPAQQPLGYGKRVEVNGVSVRLAPAGHILGSAQAVLTWRGQTVAVSGDYKRAADATCAPFEPVKCDVFITEATFGLPVFHHPPLKDEIARLLDSLRIFPERCHVVGAYALGKCQRILRALTDAGYDRPVFLHGAMIKLCELYESLGVRLGNWRPAAGVPREELAGQIVLAPPSALSDRWAAKLPDVLPAMASGWMQIRHRAKQRGVELPLVISDHADWNALLRTIDEVRAPEVWVTHGREDALIHAATARGVKAQALHLIGYEEEDYE